MPFESTVAEDVESFVVWLDSEHAPSVARHALGTVKRFYEWAEENGFYRNVAKGVSIMAVGETIGARAPICAEHALSLLSACLNDRERALVALMCLAALRPKDIERACMCDVRLDDFLPRILLGHDVAYFTPPCAKILKSYIKGEGGIGHEPLFTSKSTRSWGTRLSMRSIREIVHNVYVRSGIPGTLGTCDIAGAAVELAVESEAAPAIIAAVATRCAEQRRIGRIEVRNPYRPTERT